MVFRGFRFGMLLQLAVGPVCLFVFQSASAQGFAAALGGVAAVTLVDGLFILAAITGISAVIGRKNVRRALRLFGAVVLVLFGIHAILSECDIHLLPGFGFAGGQSSGTFAQALLLTLSNPLTILFWAGVFSGKVAGLNMGKKEVLLFGAGALLSTAVFLSLVAVAGSLIGAYLPDVAVAVLNASVGVALVAFGVRQLLHKSPDESSTHRCRNC